MAGGRESKQNKLATDIAGLVKDGRVTGISDIRDESDRKGIRLVVELKKDENAQVILNQLFKHTQLQTTFGVQQIALINGKPRTLTLMELLNAYCDHRREVIRRRSRHLLAKAERKAHILEGLITATDNIDQVIAAEIGSETIYSSLQTAATDCSGMSYNGPNSRNPPETDPYSLYSRLSRDTAIAPRPATQPVTAISGVGQRQLLSSPQRKYEFLSNSKPESPQKALSRGISPSTRDQKPETRNHEPETRHHQPETTEPRRKSANS